MNIALIAAGSVLLGYLAWAARTGSGTAAAARVGWAQARRVGFALDPVVAGPIVSRLANRVLVGAVGGVVGGAGISIWLVSAGLNGGEVAGLVRCRRAARTVGVPGRARTERGTAGGG